MVAKKPKYEPFGEELNFEVAYLQAASALDVAAYLAVESRETERLESIAALWMAMATRLEPDGEQMHQHEEDEEEEACGYKQPLGFAPAQVIEPEVDIEEVELESEDGESD